MKTMFVKGHSCYSKNPIIMAIGLNDEIIERIRMVKKQLDNSPRFVKVIEVDAYIYPLNFLDDDPNIASKITELNETLKSQLFEIEDGDVIGFYEKELYFGYFRIDREGIRAVWGDEFTTEDITVELENASVYFKHKLYGLS